MIERVLKRFGYVREATIQKERRGRKDKRIADLEWQIEYLKACFRLWNVPEPDEHSVYAEMRKRREVEGRTLN